MQVKYTFHWFRKYAHLGKILGEQYKIYKNKKNIYRKSSSSDIAVLLQTPLDSTADEEERSVLECWELENLFPNIPKK